VSVVWRLTSVLLLFHLSSALRARALLGAGQATNKLFMRFTTTARLRFRLWLIPGCASVLEKSKTKLCKSVKGFGSAGAGRSVALLRDESERLARACGIRLKRQLEPRNFLLPNLVPGAIAHCGCGKKDTQRWRVNESSRSGCFPSKFCLSFTNSFTIRVLALSVPSFWNSNYNCVTWKSNLIQLCST